MGRCHVFPALALLRLVLRVGHRCLWSLTVPELCVARLALGLLTALQTTIALFLVQLVGLLAGQEQAAPIVPCLLLGYGYGHGLLWWSDLAG